MKILALAVVLCACRSVEPPLYPVEPASIACTAPPCSILVHGQVNTPNHVPYFSGMTILDAIRWGGGMTPTANRRRVTLTRDGARYRVDLDLIDDGRAPVPILAPGDEVLVGIEGEASSDTGSRRTYAVTTASKRSAST